MSTQPTNRRLVTEATADAVTAAAIEAPDSDARAALTAATAADAADTGTALGAHLNATYDPLQEALFIPAASLTPTVGAPAIPLSSKVAAMMYDASAIESAVCNFRTPSWWVTARLTLWVAVASTGAGVVRWNPKVYGAGPGEPIAPTSGDAGIAATVDQVAPGSTNISTVDCGTFTCQPTKVHALQLQRNASSSGDTYPSDAGVVGIVISRES